MLEEDTGRRRAWSRAQNPWRREVRPELSLIWRADAAGRSSCCVQRCGLWRPEWACWRSDGTHGAARSGAAVRTAGWQIRILTPTVPSGGRQSFAHLKDRRTEIWNTCCCPSDNKINKIQCAAGTLSLSENHQTVFVDLTWENRLDHVASSLDEGDQRHHDPHGGGEGLFAPIARVDGLPCLTQHKHVLPVLPPAVCHHILIPTGQTWVLRTVLFLPMGVYLRQAGWRFRSKLPASSFLTQEHVVSVSYPSVNVPCLQTWVVALLRVQTLILLMLHKGSLWLSITSRSRGITWFSGITERVKPCNRINMIVRFLLKALFLSGCAHCGEVSMRQT